MSLLQQLFGSNKQQEVAAAILAKVQAIVKRNEQRREEGGCRADDLLYQDLRQVLPADKAAEVFERYRHRRSLSDPKAAQLLSSDIVIALHDIQHMAEHFPPMFAEHPRATQITTGEPSAAKTFAKAVNGEPITDADEDAVIFNDLLNE